MRSLGGPGYVIEPNLCCLRDNFVAEHNAIKILSSKHKCTLTNLIQRCCQIVCSSRLITSRPEGFTVVLDVVS